VDFLLPTVKLSCEKEGDKEKRKTIEKITRKGCPGLRRRATSSHLPK